MYSRVSVQNRTNLHSVTDTTIVHICPYTHTHTYAIEPNSILRHHFPLFAEWPASPFWPDRYRTDVTDLLVKSSGNTILISCSYPSHVRTNGSLPLYKSYEIISFHLE